MAACITIPVLVESIAVVEPKELFLSITSVVMQLAMVTSLYTFVTALLGFTANKHEGKITGLAAYGKPSYRCQVLLENGLEKITIGLNPLCVGFFPTAIHTHLNFFQTLLHCNPLKMKPKDIQREELGS